MRGNLKHTDSWWETEKDRRTHSWFEILLEYFVASQRAGKSRSSDFAAKECELLVTRSCRQKVIWINYNFKTSGPDIAYAVTEPSDKLVNL